jgi:hypothetical protein
MEDTQAYLEELQLKRRKYAGLRSATFSDQSQTFDLEALDKEIERVKRALRGTSGTRYASTSKGV